MKRVIFVVLAVLVVMGLALSVDAAARKKAAGKHMGMPGCEGECCCAGPHMERLKELGLDDKQMEAVKAIHFRTQKEMIRARADEQLARLEVRELLSKDTVDLKAAEAAVKKLEGIRTEMKMTHIRAMEEIKSNLTPEQRKKFISMMGEGRMMGRGKGMKRGCVMHDMDGMDDMDHDGGPREKTPPMQHRHH